MRILVTLPWGRRLGGAEAMLQTVLDGAHETGHQLELVFFEPGPWPAELIDAGFRVEVMPAAGRLRQAHRWIATVIRLARVLRARQPDLILNWAAKTQLYGAPAAMLAGMSDRVVWWQHLIPTGHWLDRCATLLPASAVGCSSAAAARAQARLSPSRPTFVVTPGAPAQSGTSGRAPLELARGVPVVGMVGRLQPWKGQDRLLRAQALLRERGHSIHTVIVGGDAYGFSSQYAESLPQLVGHLGLADAVTLTGQVPDAGPYVEQMDILVNASDPEPFGIVLLEGMARGVAVVAVDAGGPAEFVEHRRTGLLARSGEPSALADALEPLLASPALRRAVGQAGRERFMRDFTDIAMRKRFFHHLQTLVQGRNPAAGAVTIVAHDIGPVGGMERVLAELVLGLRRLGQEVTVIARKCELPASAGVVFHRVRGPSRPFLLAYPWFMVAGSLAVRRWRRGVVQATGAIVLNRVDVIAVHYCHQVGMATPSRSSRLFRWHVKVVGALKRTAERRCFRARRSATFVCVSEGVAEELREHYPEAADRIVTIHNGVDTETFAPGVGRVQARAMRAALEIPPERLVAVFVGSEWQRKGLHALIQALALSREWDLVVAGSGDEEHYSELADSLGVGEAVHWLGVAREVQLVYALGDAFVLPSSYETFSLVTFEAAASGLPILAAPVSGVRELIRDGQNGFLIAPEPQAIAERLGELAADPALRMRLGHAARQSALEFRWEETVAKHQELYRTLRPARP
jgi:glycosyltransferase involved in cell wall biosynthesis